MLKSIRHFIKNLKVQNKIIICFFIITLIMEIMNSGLTYLISSNVIFEKTINQSQETIEQLSENIEHNIRLINEKLSYLAYNPQVQSILSQKNGNNNHVQSAKNRQEMSKAMVLTYSSAIMNDIEIYGNNGQDYYISSNKKHADTYQMYMGLESKGDGRNIIINDISIGGDIEIIKEIKDIKTLQSLGLLRASLKKSVIKNIIREIDFASDGFIIVLDSDNNMVVGEQNIFNEDANKLFLKKSGNFQYSINDKDYIMVYEKSDYTNWKTIGIVSRDELQEENRAFRNKTIAITFLVIILCLFLAKILTRIIVNPLIDMIGALKAFSKGNFSVHLPVESTDEVGQLREGFNQMVIEIDTLIDDIYRRELLEKESEFKALQAQINPHFLYNTLDTINWMARKEGMDNICDMVQAIGDLMRISISNKASFITVADEIRYVEGYLYIQKVRYRDKISSIIEIDEEVKSQIIPKLIIQPIVENSVVHGIEPSKHKGVIKIIGKIDKDTSKVIFIVEDTGIGMNKEMIQNIMQNKAESCKSDKHTNLGMYTVYQRIKYFYGNDYGLTIESKEGEWTKVIITIPYQKNPNAPFRKFESTNQIRGDL